MRVSTALILLSLCLSGCSFDLLSTSEPQGFDVGEQFQDAAMPDLPSDLSELDMNRDAQEDLRPDMTSFERLQYEYERNAQPPLPKGLGDILDCSTAGIEICYSLQRVDVFAFGIIKGIDFLDVPFRHKKDGEVYFDMQCNAFHRRHIKLTVEVIHLFKSEVELESNVVELLISGSQTFRPAPVHDADGNWAWRNDDDSLAEEKLTPGQVLGFVAHWLPSRQLAWGGPLLTLEKEEDDYVVVAQDDAPCWRAGKNEIEGASLQKIESTVRKCEAAGLYLNTSNLEPSSYDYAFCHDM